MEKLKQEEIERYLQIEKEIICSAHVESEKPNDNPWGEDTVSGLTMTTTTTGNRQ